MGYQVVTVKLIDGREIRQVIVIQSSLLASVRGYAEVRFGPREIADIVVTHDKWPW
jgi:hypothetical protein